VIKVFGVKTWFGSGLVEIGKTWLGLRLDLVGVGDVFWFGYLSGDYLD